MQKLHTRGYALTLLVGCGSGAGPKGTPVEPPPPVVAQVVPDAPPPPIDAPEPKRLTCDAGLAVVPAPAPDPTWFCARPDGTRDGSFLTLFPDLSTHISGSYKDGALDGPWARHRADGSVAERGAYAAGQKDGKWQQLGSSGNVVGEYEMKDGSGVEKVWLDSGALFSETKLDKGVPHGPAKTYGGDGSTVTSATYAAGKLDGAHTFGTRPTLRFEERFANGVRFGNRLIWHFNVLIADENYDRMGRMHGAYTLWRFPRNPRVRGQFTAGRRTGNWVWTDRSNAKEKEGSYVNGKRDGLWQEWWEKRLVFSGNYAQGKPDGEFAYFDRLGNELGRFNVRDGTGTMLTFHINKKPSSRQQMFKGVPEGAYQELSFSGKLLVDGAYSGGARNGVWKELTTDGTLTKEQTWKNGKLHGVTKKYVDGKVATEMHFVENKAEGAYVELRAGKPVVTGQFAADQKTGTWTHVDADGATVLTSTYKDGVLEGPWRQLVDGVVIEGAMVAGRRSGTWTQTDKSGAVRKFAYSTP